jgi:protein ImuA
MLPHIKAFPLRPARVHEACGPLAVGLAAVSAAHSGTDLVWVRESWRSETISPAGLAAYTDPSRLLFTQVKDQAETLAVGEESLRSGAVPLVVLELTEPLSLTAGRRLQLAAQAGQSTGLCLVQEGMGSNAAETRWRCSPLPDPDSSPEDSTLQCWELIKNKSGTLGVWHVRWSQSARRLIVVSPARE